MILAAALTLTLKLERTSFDPLDTISVEVVAHNAASKPIQETFPKPAEYEISILKHGTPVWTSERVAPLGATIPSHTRLLMPGPNVLAVFIWNGIESDGTTPGPGDYTVRAKLLGANDQPDASLAFHFINPVPVSALFKLKVGDEVTIAGNLNATEDLLTDATGSIPLGKRLTLPKVGIAAVRGFIIERPDHTRALRVTRFAIMN